MKRNKKNCFKSLPPDDLTSQNHLSRIQIRKHEESFMIFFSLSNLLFYPTAPNTRFICTLCESRGLHVINIHPWTDIANIFLLWWCRHNIVRNFHFPLTIDLANIKNIQFLCKTELFNIHSISSKWSGCKWKSNSVPNFDPPWDNKLRFCLGFSFNTNKLMAWLKSITSR